MNLDVPGLFFYLVRDGVLSAEAVAPLIDALPEEKIVQTAVRGGEAFDSTRWPVARDAAIANFAARRLGESAIDHALGEIARAGGDRAELDRLAKTALAQWMNAGGEIPTIVVQLYQAHFAAADGMFTAAYRGRAQNLRRPSSEGQSSAARSARPSSLLRRARSSRMAARTFPILDDAALDRLFGVIGAPHAPVGSGGLLATHHSGSTRPSASSVANSSSANSVKDLIFDWSAVSELRGVETRARQSLPASLLALQRRPPSRRAGRGRGWW
jgi:hypothetical protein